MTSVLHSIVRPLALGLALVGCSAGALAATGSAAATATVVEPVSIAQPVAIGDMVDTFPPLITLPVVDSNVPERVIPIGAGALAPLNADTPGGAAIIGAIAATAAGSGGTVQTTRNPDGSVSMNITGGASVAHVITRSPDGQLHVDFN